MLARTIVTTVTLHVPGDNYVPAAWEGHGFQTTGNYHVLEIPPGEEATLEGREAVSVLNRHGGRIVGQLEIPHDKSDPSVFHKNLAAHNASTRERLAEQRRQQERELQLAREEEVHAAEEAKKDPQEREADRIAATKAGEPAAEKARAAAEKADSTKGARENKEAKAADPSGLDEHDPSQARDVFAKPIAKGPTFEDVDTGKDSAKPKK